ncbi:MAG: hypothetical protein K2K80_01000 [Clostridia bacterium]|nr:hypothetical protein [Clostridia bacterium]
MYGIYGDIISAAERALDCYEETKELLEYPEVQADKAYYLSVLSKYNNLKFLKDKLSALISALDEERELMSMLSEANSDGERTAIYEEISSLKRIASGISAELSDAVGCKHINERVYCRFKLGEVSSKFGTALFQLIKSDLLSRGAKTEQEKVVAAKGGYVREISFIADGEDVTTRLAPLTGAHKVYIVQAKSEELCFAITPAARLENISESDLKIDVFHSHGAGGQNINKVETAVRVTHLPTGLSVVCQDERSQLKNKKRALENIEKRLKDISGQTEKNRIEADICAQYSKKNTPISFDAANNTFTDTRLKAFSKIPFPLSSEQFTSYINGLIAL